MIRQVPYKLIHCKLVIVDMIFWQPSLTIPQYISSIFMRVSEWLSIGDNEKTTIGHIIVNDHT